MDVIQKSKHVAQLKKALEDAKEYIGKIGKPEPHFREGTVGRLVGWSIETQIHHQASPSAQNYWKNMDFDAALEAVIFSEFPRLATLALERMHTQYVEANIGLKADLQAALAEIEQQEATIDFKRGFEVDSSEGSVKVLAQATVPGLTDAQWRTATAGSAAQ